MDHAGMIMVKEMVTETVTVMEMVTVMGKEVETK